MTFIIHSPLRYTHGMRSATPPCLFNHGVKRVPDTYSGTLLKRAIVQKGKASNGTYSNKLHYTAAPKRRSYTTHEGRLSYGLLYVTTGAPQCQPHQLPLRREVRVTRRRVPDASA
ncbi:unnamed protein product [Ectocarpus sp. 6 AP-2014]